MDIRVGGKFKITKRLGQGAFGDLFAGNNVKTGEEVAVKLEPIYCDKPQLNYESQIMTQFSNSRK